MGRSIEREELIAALRLRYDHHSAEAVFDAARSRAALPSLAEYDEAQVHAFRIALARVGDRLAAVDRQLDALSGGPAIERAAPVVAQVATPAPPPPVEEVAEPEPAPVEVAAAPVEEVEEVAAPVEDVVAPQEAVEAIADAPITEVLIELTGVEVDDDAEVLVCGGFDSLGEWEPERALRLARVGDAWTASIEIALGTELAFKFLQRRANGELIWEGGENRTVVAEPRINAVWR